MDALTVPTAPVPTARAPVDSRPLYRRLAAPVGVLAGVIAAFGYVGTVDPNQPGHYPACPLLQVTGIFCPGCGGLRSAHAVAHGDLVTALGANALAVAGYLVFAVVIGVWLVRAVKGRRMDLPPLRAAHWWVLGTLVLIFTVARNLPFGAGLAP